MSDSAESQDYGRSVDHGGEHKDRAPASVLGGASAKGGPTDQEDPKGESIPGYDPQNQPDFAYQKPGSHDGAGIVSQVMGR
ncbi:MAG: hypothetical protein GOMPHAMPRED_007750 [Gomphillus americanus]|uniref:Uncharacterized protein n=1 Tax=Gomphillus americanus TaxID=1940652 RepID=A0A8H3IGF2_9LECA|nr:MAG: hypothetical protein GOMPHAMPRED_007750 [Gomphillus americanus]